MFASEYKAKSRDAINRVSTEPAFIFVCNNSYFQYKKFQKRVRFYSKTAFVGILICTIITSSILYFMMPGKPSSFAATYNWVQSGWSGGADTVNFPVHPTNGTGWEKYYEKDSYTDISTEGEIKLSQTSSSWTETSDVDFNTGGNPTNVQTSGTGDAADLILLPPTTTTTTTFSAGDTDADEAGASNINFDTANGVVKLDYSGLSDYSYRKKITLTGQTGAGTNYQVKLLVGESSGATGENFDLGSNCYNFPNDLRFTDNNETTMLDYWIESTTGTTPNQLSTIWVEVKDDLSSGTVDIYIYYGGSPSCSGANPDCCIANCDGDNTCTSCPAFCTGECGGTWGGTSISSGIDTFNFFDDFSGAAKWTASGTGTYGTSGEGYVSASQTGSGTKTKTLTTTDAIGSGTFKATMRIKNPSPTQESGTSYSYTLKETTTGANLYVSPTDNNAGYVSKTYTLASVTNAKLQLYASATGSGGNYCIGQYEECWYIDYDCEFSECGQYECETCNGTWTTGTAYTASASVYVDDVYVRKYISPEPAYSSTESSGIFPTYGAFTSTNLLAAQSVGPIDSFSYKLALPAGTTGAKVCFTQDDPSGTPTWHNSSNTVVPAGDSTNWNTLSDSGVGENEIFLSALSWTGANFYYKMEYTSDGSDTPVLDEIAVHTNYPPTGNLISSIKDTGVADPDFTTVTWNETLNTYGDVDLKVRSSDSSDMTGATDWASISVIESSGGDISGIGNGQYVQYQAILSTTDQAITPQLHDVTVSQGTTSTLTSSPYDASDSGQVINQIVWTETAPTDTNVKFQMRTAPESSGAYTIWMGPDGTADTYFDESSSGCSKTGSDVTCDILNTLGISDGVNDKWMQYKVWLTTSVAETPVLSNVNIQYVVNALPVVSNTTASQGTDGVISISYDLSDADSSSFTVSALADIGVTLNQELISDDISDIAILNIDRLPAASVGTPRTIQIENEQIIYTGKLGNEITGITRGANNTKALSHSSTTAVWIKGSTVSGNVGASQTAGTGKSISWTIKTDLDGVYYATAKIRVAANDGNAANQVGNGDSVAFALDTKDPVLGANPILIDASSGLDSTTLTLDATDDTAIEMKLSNNTDLSADGVNADSGTWISYASSKLWILSTDPDTVYVQFRDSKGNTTATQSLESLLTPEYFMIQDISNLDSSEFREFVAWKVSTISSFQDYILESSTDDITYSTLTTITDQAFNYYTHPSLVLDQDYYYQVYQQDTLGNKSPRTTAKHGRANGAQDFDEGGGGTVAGTDTTAPTVTHDYLTQVTSVTSTTATITFTTGEMSDSYIGYSTDTGYGNEQGIPTMIAGGEDHTITLVGLTENTPYYYKIKSRDASDNVGEENQDAEENLFTFTTITDTTAPVITFTSATDVTSVTDSSAVISWTTDEAATSLVDYGVDTSYGSNEANANYNFDHSITLSSLLPETTYYFKLTSVDNSISNNSATDDNSTAGYTFTTLASSDTTPPVISVVSSGTPLYNTATITWTTDENASSLVDFGTDTNYGTTQGNSADSTTSHSVVLTGLASDTTYYYRVKSMDVSGNTAINDNSEAGWTFLTAAASEGDTAPEISSVSGSSVTSTGATITWTTNESSDSTVGFSLDTSFDQEQGSITMTTSHSIDLINLAPETTYYYQVKSRDAAGNLGTDNNSEVGYSFTTLAGGDALAPVISDVTISDLTANTAKITWTTNENSNSLVDYSGTSGVFTSTAGQYQDNTISHTVILRGLDPSTAYYLQARSTDASSNEGKDSNGGTGYTFTTTAGGDETPPEITNIAAGTPTYNSVTITWTTNELSSSLVDFGTSTSYGTTQGNSADSVTSHSVTLTGLTPSTAYYYRVKSIDTSGNLVSDDNSEAGHTFTTAAGADLGDTTAPVITFDSSAGITNITSNSATIAWTTDESSDSIIGYGLDTSFNSEKGSATLATSHSVILNNLSSGTAYKFQLKSMDASGNLTTENNSGDGYTFTTLAGGDSTAPIITGVSSGTCTDTTCAIAWSTNENSSSLVDYGTVLGTYASTGGNYKDTVTTHAVTLSGLTAETTYYYRVRSIDANDNQALDSGGSNGYSFTTTATAESECPACPSCGGGGSCPSTDTNPPTISNITVSAITTNSVVVKWETNENGYSIAEFGLDDSYGGITGLYNNSVKSHSVKINGLESSVIYHYRVASADSSGNLAQSEDFTFKTVTFDELSPKDQEEQTSELNETTAAEIQTKIEELLDQGIDEEEIRIIIARASEPPVISTEGPLVENVTNSSAKVVWITDRKSNSVIRFKAEEEGIDPETSSSLKQYGNFKELTVEHQVILASLNSGTSYQYQVQSSDVLGNTSKSDWHKFDTEITPSIYDVVISEITLNSAVISWKTNVVTSSKVEYGETISYTDSIEDKGLSKVAKHSIKLNNLRSGTLYHFRVRGISGEGNSLVSDDYSFTTFTLPQIETYQIEEIDERTIKLNWKTNVETDSTLKYTDLETNITKTQGEDGMSSIHNFTLKGLNPGKEYLLQIQGRDIYGNQAITSEFAAATLADNTVPEIKQIRTETAVSSGKSDVVQTIISWKTNEPTTSQILWEEGISQDEEPQNSTPEDENYTTNHIMVITTFKPASVYRFRIQGKDKAGNIGQSQDFTILIPEKKKSVIQIIISNFEDTFGWVKKLGL